MDTETGHLNEIRIHSGSIEYDITDSQGSLIAGEEWFLSPTLSQMLKDVLLKKVDAVVTEGE